ncbi:MAG TPA: hypothetical protein P5015_03810 [Candidatus Omnitrophota bacterium]|nr:hypothetical protein [Candidatus Omnitrophota bacterium]
MFVRKIIAGIVCVTVVLSNAGVLLAKNDSEDVLRVTAAQLIQKAKDFNGKTVIIQGEVIGDVMPRGEFAWLNIDDTSHAIGVWAPKAMVSGIRYTGDYQYKGDTIEVRGRFFRADADLSGELCIRAQKIITLKEGYRTFRILRPAKAEISLALSLVVFCLGSIILFIRKRTPARK